MKQKIFILIIFGYGFGLEYRNDKDIKNIEKAKKYRFSKCTHEFSNWYFAFGFFHKYTLVFRIYLNRE